jgi:hypothetical protein
MECIEEQLKDIMKNIKKNLLKKSLKLCSFNDFMVRRRGFEPPANWFVASYSIQLSYRRILGFMAEKEGFEPSRRLPDLRP